MRVNGVDASYLYVQDLGRATEFYTKLLGAEPTTVVGDIVREWTLPYGESFGVYKPGPEEGGFRHGGGVLFNVEDVEAARDAARSWGVVFHGEIEETAVCHMAFGQDSEGNGFILHRRKDDDRPTES